METELMAVRADQDRLEERLDAVELSAAVVARDQEVIREPVGRPPLKVIRLAPDDGEPPPKERTPSTPPRGPGESDEQRPVIRGTGDHVIQTGGSASADESNPSRPVIALRGDREATPDRGR